MFYRFFKNNFLKIFFSLVNCILNGNFSMELELDEKFKLNKFEIQKTQLNEIKVRE